LQPGPKRGCRSGEVTRSRRWGEENQGVGRQRPQETPFHGAFCHHADGRWGAISISKHAGGKTGCREFERCGVSGPIMVQKKKREPHMHGKTNRKTATAKRSLSRCRGLAGWMDPHAAAWRSVGIGRGRLHRVRQVGELPSAAILAGRRAMKTQLPMRGASVR
jgi:hypothetical protein